MYNERIGVMRWPQQRITLAHGETTVLGWGVLEHLVASGLIAAAKGRGQVRLVAFSAWPRRQELRVSFSSLLRIRRRDRYLLIRNHWRPEQFGPIGGVNKYYGDAEKFLDEIQFEPQVFAADMEKDLRGFLPPRCLPRLVRWYRKRDGCETAEACLRRELREELQEIGVTALHIPDAIAFRAVREIWEGPRRVLGESYKQFRIFQICDIRTDVDGPRDFVEELWRIAARSEHLLAPSRNEITRGRAENGGVIGALSEYMFRSRLGRPDGPAFVARREESAGDADHVDD